MGGQKEFFSEVAVSYSQAKVIILPVPYGRSYSSRGGTENAPGAIFEVSDNLEMWDEETGGEVSRLGLATLPSIENVLEWELLKKLVSEQVKRVYKDGKFLITIGGDHIVTIPVISNIKKFFPANPGVVYLDAHTDCRNVYQGSFYSHACVARRIIEEEKVPLVLTGVRSFSREEWEFIKREKISLFPGNQFVIKMKEIFDLLPSFVYVSIDVDVFDPAIIPAVTCPEPGGVLWQEMLLFLRQLAIYKKIVGFDVVELAPIAGLDYPQFTVAKLIYKFLSYIFLSS